MPENLDQLKFIYSETIGCWAQVDLVNFHVDLMEYTSGYCAMSITIVDFVMWLAFQIGKVKLVEML